MPGILYVITDLELGGVPLHLFHLAREMRRRGLLSPSLSGRGQGEGGVSVVSLAPPGSVGEMLRGEGIEVETCGGRGGWDLRVVPRLAAIFRRRRPDVVHSMLFHANVASRWAGRLAGVPRERIICEIQTVEVERRWHLLVDRLTHRGCRFTIGNSPSVIEHLHARAGIPRERLRLVRGGIDAARVQSAEPIARSALGLGDDARVVLWVGRLDPVKGLDHLLAAFAELPTELRAHLLLAGGGPLHDRLMATIAARGLAGRAHLLGARRDVPSLLKTCDVFAFPSRTEGLPNALLEAMAAGCAIVTTDAPGCRDLVRHDSNGLVVAYGDVPALSAALRRLLVDRELAARLGAEARRSAECDWRIADTYEAYARIYNEVM